MKRMDLESRFKAGVIEHLGAFGPSLVDVLRQLVEHDFPADVVRLHFEVFVDGFTEGFPVRAFFLDADESEYFVYEDDGEAAYPSPVDPVLLEPEHVFDMAWEDTFLAEDEDLDTMTLAGEALIPWFAACWKLAGGAGFARRATIALHDGDKSYDLVHGVWGANLS